MGDTLLMMISFTFLNAEKIPQQSQRGQSIQPGPDVIGDYAGTARQALQIANWKGLHDIENSK
jgi:hypothetical protein